MRLCQAPGASVSVTVKWAPHLPKGAGWGEGDAAAFYQVKGMLGMMFIAITVGSS